jgi:hypothetical protein
MKVLLTAALCVLPMAAGLCVLPASPRAATYVFDTTDEDGQLRHSTAVLTPEALCMTSDGTDAASNVSNGADGVFVDNPPTFYYRRGSKVEKLDQARIDELKSKMSAAFGDNPDLQKKLEAALANVPPAQREAMRKQMEKMMGAAMPKAAPAPDAALERTYKATGKAARVGSYNAVEYAAMEGKAKVGTVMLAPISAVPQGDVLLGRLRAMMEFVKSMTSQFGVGGAGFSGTILNIPSGYFPVAGQELDENGKVTSDMKLASVTSATPDSCKIPE